jgi:hypothetical protein
MKPGLAKLIREDGSIDVDFTLEELHVGPWPIHPPVGGRRYR